MTKAENRAAAKAWHQVRMRQRDEEARAKTVELELAELDRLRRYLIRGRTLGHVCPLIEAIDDCVEQITGDRTPPTKIHLRRDARDRLACVLVYCQCRHHVELSADHWPDDPRLSDPAAPGNCDP